MKYEQPIPSTQEYKQGLTEGNSLCWVLVKIDGKKLKLTDVEQASLDRFYQWHIATQKEQK